MNNLTYLKEYTPDSAAVILTDKCSAACRECCFQCNPSNNATLSNEEIFSFINEISELPHIKYIVWTGGEAFTLGKRLVTCVEYAKNKGLVSRIVSNGYWAANNSIAKKKLTELALAGLCELNLSTGDNHQEFVSIDKVLTAAFESLKLGITTVISIETTKYSKFKENDLYKHEIYQQIKEEGLLSGLHVMSSAWVSFHTDTVYDYDTINQVEVENGCNNLFNFIGLNPNNEVISCCGLTVGYVGELRLGNHNKISVLEAYNTQKSDFMKKWLFVKGPINILKQVKFWDPSITIPKFAHHCQSCAYIYQAPEISECIRKHYKEIEDDINIQFLAKLKLNSLLS